MSSPMASLLKKRPEWRGIREERSRLLRNAVNGLGLLIVKWIISKRAVLCCFTQE